MKTLRKHITSAVVFGLLLILSACSKGSKSPLVGHWQSFELGGKDMGTQLKEVDYDFSLDGHFSAVGIVSGGQKQAFSGQYSVGTTNLDLNVDGKGLEMMPYTLKDGVLTIRDPKLDSYVAFRRSADANP